MKARHLPALDGIRGLAILAVMLVHFADFSGFMSAHEGPWIDEAYRRMAGYGGYGVTLFFVLSGFLITGILLDAKGKPGAWRNFFARRVLRIFPLYYAVLAVSFVALPLLGRVAPAESPVQGWYWAYLSNFWMAGHGWPAGALGHTWSLAVEEQFYLVWPFAVFGLSRKGLARLSVSLVVGAAALRAALVLGRFPDLYVLATPCQVDGLAWGALFAIAVRGGEAWASPRLAAALVAVGVPGVLLVTGRHGLSDVLMASPGDTLAGATLRTFMTLACAGLVLAGVRAGAGGLVDRALCARPLRTLGKYSYGLYLLHVPLGISMRDRGLLRLERWPAPLGSQLPAVLLATAIGGSVTFVAAWMSWHLLEKRVLALKGRFDYATLTGRGDATAS